MKFRKKPVVIEAIQWIGNNQNEINIFVPEEKRFYTEGPVLHINTLEGAHTANVNDWIIRGVKGEFYPCKPDIFLLTYEPANVTSTFDKIDTVDELNEKIVQLTKQKNGAYWERNQLVAALSKLLPAGLGKHDPNDKEWEDDWRNIVYIIGIGPHFELVQMSWHIHDSELPMFSHLKFDPDIKWDGHTTEEKYKRLARMTNGGVIANDK